MSNKTTRHDNGALDSRRWREHIRRVCLSLPYVDEQPVQPATSATRLEAERAGVDERTTDHE